MKKTIFITIIILLVLVAFLVFWEIILPLLSPSTGRLSLVNQSGTARVLIDGKEVATTPFYSDHLRVGDHKIEVELTQNPGFRFITNTTLNSSTLAVVDLDLASSQLFSSGENLYLKAGLSGISLLSRPEGATVTIDGKIIGKTPINQGLPSGVHTVKIQKDGYLDREVPLNIESGYKLSALVYLSANPFAKVEKIESLGKTSLFRITNSFVDLTKAFSAWADGVSHAQSYFADTETKFDYLIDSFGKTYILNPTEWANKKAAKGVVNIGYLTKNPNDKLNDKAKFEWENLKSEFNK